MTVEQFRQLALSLPGTEETAHFERAAFKITGRRIFATLHETSQTINLPLTPADQASFTTLDASCIYPVPNKWGENGWTTLEITQLDPAIVTAALETAYQDALQAKPRRK